MGESPGGESSEGALTGGTILYELICCGEWRDEHEEKSHLHSSPNRAGGLLSKVSPTKYFKKKSLSVPESVKWLKSAGPPWKIALSKDGSVVAVLQDFILETRSAKDNFSSTLGRTAVLKDPHLSHRQMAWSQDGSILAISYSNGQVIFYDVMASIVTSVRRYDLPSQEGVGTDVFNADNSLAALIFSSDRVKKHTHPNELICVDGKGFIKCFRQNQPDQMSLHHGASLRAWYPKGIYGAVPVESHGLMIVSGQVEQEFASQPSDESLKSGITVWRFVNDAPYYRIVFSVDTDDFRMDSKRKWRFAFSALFPNSTKMEDAVFKMVVSRDDKHVAALHVSGTISVWHIPSLQKLRWWPLKNQYHHWTENTRFNNRWRVAYNRWNEEPVDEWRFHPYDVDWWNENTIIVSRVNGCVSLCSIEEDLPSRNLLGDLPELFESPVPVTPRQGKGFLALECEIKLKVEERRNSNGEIISSPASLSLEVLDAYDSQFLAKTLIQEVLFWMTDIERFRPPRKRKRKRPIWKQTHRLFLIRNITPLELFYQKIESEEYGEALDLAKAYNLDSDIVYQRQWAKSPVSINSIRDYLAKIKKRNWVLQECLERVPDTVDAARELLQFGLKGTDLSVAVIISQGKDKGRFRMMTPDDLDISQEEYLLLVDHDNLEVKRLLNYRKKFLYFLDMLDTYELMVGGPRSVDENFDGNVYSKLRSNSPVDSATEMARSSDISTLRVMLTHHWFDIASSYLEVLSSFPETTCPYDYRDFLPELCATGEVILWDEYVPKKKDWCENFLEAGSKLRRASAGSLVPDITPDQICAWYENRVREIDSCSGITCHALDLAKLGVKKGIYGLTEVMQALEMVEIMVYDGKVEITLEQLEELSDFERLRILMSNVKTENYANQVREFVLPFLEKCEEREKGARYRLLEQYLTSVSSSSLENSLQMFLWSKPGTINPIITDKQELMRLAFNCIYSCRKPGQVSVISKILDCLPERSRGMIKEDIKVIQEKLEELELHFQGLKILEKYDISLALSEVKNLANNENSADRLEKFFQKICNTPRMKKLDWKISDWKSMLFDVLDLQKKIFTSFPVERCFEIYVESLLRSGSIEVINLVRDFIDRTVPDGETKRTGIEGIKGLVRRVSSAYSTSFALYLYLIPYDKSLDMVMNTAQMYFDSASNYADTDIELCKVCMNLMQNLKEPSISLMFDLIDAVKIINKDFQLNILPQSVRVVRDKKALIRQCMENIQDGYKKTQQLLKIGMFLRLEDMTYPETESYIFDMCGNAALMESDMKFCVQICHNIMAKGYHTGWKIFSQVAKHQSDPPVLDHQTRLVFINYALNMCPDDEIFNVLNSKYLIEIRSLQSRIAELSPDNSSLDESLLDVPEQNVEAPDSLNPEKFQQFLSTTTRWINPLKEMAHVVSTRSGSLLKSANLASLANPLFLDSAFEGDSILNSSESDMKTVGFVQESYPAFYLSRDELASRHFRKSFLAFQYNTFSSSVSSDFILANPALELCITLNRIWHLERSLLGPQECLERDETVVEQLVAEILPEDLLWGMAILLSIENVEAIGRVLSRIPSTPTSLTVILYFLSVSILKRQHIENDEDLYLKDPNKVIAEVAEQVTSLEIDDDDPVSYLQKLFRKYNQELSEFKRSRGYKEMELELLGKANREKVNRLKNLVNLAFELEKLDELDLVHASGRKELLDRLTAKASTLEEFSCIIEILRTAWVDQLSTSAKKNEWVQILCAMVKSEEGIVHEEIIAVLKQLEEEGKMLHRNCFFCIMGEAKRQQANMLFCRLGFMSKDPQLQLEAAKMIKRCDYEVEDLDEEVLYQLIKKGYLSVFIQKKEFYEGLILVLLEHQQDKSRNWPNIETVAEQLKNAGHEAEAEELVQKHGGSIPGLNVFKSALNIGSWSKWGKSIGEK